MKRTAFCILTVGLLGSRFQSSADIFFPMQTGTGANAVTNVLTPVPASGTLLIRYDFFQIPDQLDVYYDNSHLFSSGLIFGSGQFIIPYGPGASDSLFIVMDQTPESMFPDSNWQYTPSVAPVPEPGLLAFCALSVLGILARNRRLI